MNSRCRIYTAAKSIVYENSSYKAISAEANTKHGYNTHLGIIDELHAHKSRGMWDVLNTGTGSREQPLLFAITTAGNNQETICFEQRDYSQKVLEGAIEDPEYFPFVCEIDPEDGRTEPIAGKVSWISPEAEFTPKNVQSREARADLVYAVKITIPNPEQVLKIGMPVMVRIP